MSSLSLSYWQLDPILAQGVGVAIEDAHCIVYELSKSQDLKPENIARAFQKYERSRLTRLKILHHISNISQYLGQHSSPSFINFRDSLFVHSPSFLKSIMFDLAIGLSLSRNWTDLWSTEGLPPHSLGYRPEPLVT